MTTRTKFTTLLALTGLLAITATSAHAQAYSNTCIGSGNQNICTTAFIKKRPSAAKFTVQFNAAVNWALVYPAQPWKSGVGFEGNVFNKSGDAVITTIRVSPTAEGAQAPLYTASFPWRSQTLLRARVWTKTVDRPNTDINATVYASIAN